jgi:hypothetical protein
MRVDPAYREALRAAGLLRVGDVLARVDGRVAAWSRSTDTVYLPGRPGEPGFFVKRYLYPTWRKRWRAMLRGTFFGLHRGQAEYQSLHTLRALGVSAARPVAWGVRRVAHFVTACYLITEAVPDVRNLTTFARDVQTGRQRLTPCQRRRLIQVLARQVADLHATGVAHGQLFWRNILVRHGLDGQPEFFFLDAQIRRSWPRLATISARWRHELACLAVSAEPFTRRTERLRFLYEYLGRPPRAAHVKTAACEIARLARPLQRHERQRIKMNDLFEEWNRQLPRECSAEATPAAPRLAVLASGVRR